MFMHGKKGQYQLKLIKKIWNVEFTLPFDVYGKLHVEFKWRYYPPALI